MFSPGGIAQDDNAVATSLILFRRERASHRRSHAEDVEYAGGYERAGEVRRRRFGGQAEVPGAVGRNGIKSRAAVNTVHVIRNRVRGRTAVVDIRDDNQSVWIR